MCGSLVLRFACLGASPSGLLVGKGAEQSFLGILKRVPKGSSTNTIRTLSFYAGNY